MDKYAHLLRVVLAPKIICRALADDLCLVLCSCNRSSFLSGESVATLYFASLIRKTMLGGSGRMDVAERLAVNPYIYKWNDV